jgi:hypothetical protein
MKETSDGAFVGFCCDIGPPWSVQYLVIQPLDTIKVLFDVCEVAGQPAYGDGNVISANLVNQSFYGDWRT